MQARAKGADSRYGIGALLCMGRAGVRSEGAHGLHECIDVALRGVGVQRQAQT